VLVVEDEVVEALGAHHLRRHGALDRYPGAEDLASGLQFPFKFISQFNTPFL